MSSADSHPSRRRLRARDDGALVAIGARPDPRPTPSFGYMLGGRRAGARGCAMAKGGVCQVSRFVEKPGPLQAEEFIADGAMWNTGIYCWQAGAVLDALETNTTELQDGLAYLANGKVDRFFGMVQSVSIERGLLERIDSLICVPSSFGWDDVGTWACLRRVRELDDTGNGVIGDALLVDAESNVVHTESGRVVVVRRELAAGAQLAGDVRHQLLANAPLSSGHSSRAAARGERIDVEAVGRVRIVMSGAHLGG
ncbi:MAG: sugar phosphate nucleotidyltransferase [Gemmatimonadaceae bacterium]|nr:sugar phosphate nucleotidyltransferase [Gemmatimonadaceae bacterium]